MRKILLVVAIVLASCVSTQKPWDMRLGKQNCDIEEGQQVCGVEVIFWQAECQIAGGVPMGIDPKTNESHNGVIVTCPIPKSTK